MSVRMKKQLTKITVGARKFKLPKKEAKIVLNLVESISGKFSSHVNASVIYKEFSKDRPKGAIYLRGIRTRESLTQKELENITGIPVSNLSKYESGARKITRAVAERLAQALNANLKRLLEV